MQAITDKLKGTTAQALGQRQYNSWGMPLFHTDPLLDLARKAGFKVVEYDLPPYPLVTAGWQALSTLGFMVGTTVLSYVLYYTVGKTYAARVGCVGLVSAILLAWPVFAGRSGCMMLDFWRPALGFRSALLVYDIFCIRTREEVDNWSFARFFCGLWAFPMEEEDIAEREKREGFKRNARWENMKGYPKVFIEGIIFLGTLYVLPPYAIAQTMSQLQYHLYCDAMGISILMALALFGDGLLKGMGIILGIEMQDMFESPLSTINIRLFWSHWNRAIASVFHRVIFAGGKKKAAGKQKAAASKRVAQLAQEKRSHLDHLSETEAETSRTDDEDGGARARKSGLKMTSSKQAEAPKKNAAASKPPAKKSSFLPKAAAAIVTFGMSGIFHEHITYNTMGIADGLNFLFFLANGVATVASTWFRRTYPELNAKIPTLVAVLMLHTFFLAVIPLFCTVFIKSEFFIQMESLKWHLLPVANAKRGAFIYLFGQPPK